jgi:SWI/SNF-related matrix-associated actin-dependent regulator of chromatin subfamily D
MQTGWQLDLQIDREICIEQMAEQGRRSAETAQAAPKKRKRRGRTESESSLPEDVARQVPSSAPYMHLREVERELDAAFASCLAQARDATWGSKGQCERSLRLYAFNTASNDGSWTLHLHGRLVSSPNADDSLRLSDCLRSLRLWLLHPHESSSSPLQHQQPDVSWHRESSFGSIDGFEIKRFTSQPTLARFELDIDRGAERYLLSDPLSRILDLSLATKAVVITALWRYIRTNRLQADDDPSTIVCDENLKAIFKKPSLNLSAVSDKLNMHLRRAEPIQIDHLIDTSGPGPFCRECYDVKIDSSASQSPLHESKLEKLASHWSFEQVDERMSYSIARLREHLRKRDFFESFAQSPGRFMQSLVASQAADLRTFSATSERDALERWSGYYAQPWAYDAAAQYLQERRRAGV